MPRKPKAEKPPEPEIWKPDLAPKQEQLIRLCNSKTGGMKLIGVFGTRKSGKCLTVDTVVYTPNGPVRIGQISCSPEGHFSPCEIEVLSFDQEQNATVITKTDQFYNSGTIDGFEIVTNRGYRLRCSDTHPIWCELNGVIEYFTSSQINRAVNAGKEVWIPRLRQNTHWPDARKTIDFSFKTGNQFSAHQSMSVVVDSDLAYLAGIMVGDGCYSPPVMKGHACGFSSVDEEIINSLNRILSEKFGGRTTRRSNCDYGIVSRSFRAFLVASSMGPKYSYEKEAPDFIFGSPKDVVISFLQGVFDTDGTVCKKGSSQFCSTSKKLAFDVQQLLLSVGVRSSVNFKTNKHKGAWILRTLREDEFCNKVGFRLSRKQRIASMPRPNLSESSCYPPSIISALKRLYTSRKKRGVRKINRFDHRVTIGAVFRRNVPASKKRLLPILRLLNCENDKAILKYTGSNFDLWWDRVSELNPIREQMVDLSVPHFRNFIANGTISHNTTGALHAIADHLFNTENASVLVLCYTAGTAATSGVWSELTEKVVPEWIAGDFGMQWFEPPKIHGSTKKMIAKVINRFGGISKLELDTLDDEREVEKKYKSRYYSMIYWSEAGEFKEKKSLATLIMALRVLGLPQEKHILLADANPPDEGEDHFLHKFFYDNIKADPKSLDEVDRALLKCTHVTEWTMDDNPYLSDLDKSIVKGVYKDDPDMYDRYIRGMWKKATKGTLFADLFSIDIHVVGQPSEADPEILIPNENCDELVTGHDSGGVNPVSYILEKEFIGTEIHNKRTNKMEWKEVSYFKVLDELAFIGEEISVSEFTAQFVEKQISWEEIIQKEVKWRDWADRSALDVKESIANRSVAQEMYIESNGKLDLVGVEKGSGSVSARIRLMRKLLKERRLLVSGSKCPKLVEMLRYIKCGKAPYTIPVHSPYKHPFDALTYALAKECWEEMEELIALINNPLTTTSSQMLSIRL